MQWKLDMALSNSVNSGNNENRFQQLILGMVLFVFFSLPSLSFAECTDEKAKKAGNDKALGYFKKAELLPLHPTRIQKRHHPSKNKEVASYVKLADGRIYVIFTLVKANCVAHFRKRTRQND